MLDVAEGFGEVEWVDRDIAGVDGTQPIVDPHFQLLAVVTTEDRRLENGARPEPGARTEGHHRIERHAQNGQIDRFISDGRRVPQMTECRDTAEGRSIAWVRCHRMNTV